MKLRITLLSPPPGVGFSLQDKKQQLFQHTPSTGADITFELEMEIDADGRAKGPFAMGPPAARFLYINSGSYAGQPGTVYNRRAKIPLTGLPAAPVAVAEINGRAKDGGPACATVPLLNGGWRAARS
ncbi:MAG: hypothetical protein JNM66_17095 [Bryobacterales bacterium]|nr:hypothetical protein [Bryobacterales bacterium]